MSITAAIPDVHEEIDSLLYVLDKYSYVDHFVFSGDYLDSHRSTRGDYHNALRVMATIKPLLDDPKYTFLLGNHDVPYAFGIHSCSGYNYMKKVEVNQIITREDWKKFKLHTIVDNWVISHAGFNKHFADPIYGLSELGLSIITDKALNSIHDGRETPLCGAGYSRGGSQRVGGVTWQDFRDEFKPIAGMNQLFGHTAGHNVRNIIMPNKKDANSINYCYDVIKDDYKQLNVVALIEDGNITFEKVEL